ncbi:MAG: BtrH N-terminal domain-containing protein, partial [Cytophagales bacterium]|nr:BtrH N-terminal domain-containing protein [Cytophagales bacterium]
MKIDFEHKQSAHCENGVTTNLLHHIGVEQISEPLAFGIGAGIFYIHIPFMMINNGPALAFRSMPGSIFKKTCNSLGIPVVRETFNSREKAQRVLDSCLEKGQPVGCQV